MCCVCSRIVCITYFSRAECADCQLAATAASPSLAVLSSLAALAQTYLPDSTDDSEEYTRSLQHKDSSNAKATAPAAGAAAGTVVVDESAVAAETASSDQQRDSDDEAAAAAAVAPRAVRAHITEALRRCAVRPASASRSGRAAGSDAAAAAAAVVASGTTAAGTAAAAGTESTAALAARAWDRFRTGRSPLRSSNTTSCAAGAAAAGAATAGAQQAQQRETSLEEPYAVQVAAPVFAKLHALLTRSLDAQLLSNSNTSSSSSSSSKHAVQLHKRCETAYTRTLCLLQLTRVNFARLVATHVDPAEVGLQQQQQAAGGHMHDLLLLLRSIMHCEGSSCSELRLAAADTFASGLPLLLPKCSQRLSLLLSLLRAASCDSTSSCSNCSGSSCDAKQQDSLVSNTATLAVADAAEVGPVAPDATAVLLRHVMQHFAHTQSLLQLLSLFKCAQQHRDSVAELLQLLLQALLRASKRQCREDDCCSDAPLASLRMTAMMLQLLETLQQHLGKQCMHCALSRSTTAAL
jgi:hypothetical protein